MTRKVLLYAGLAGLAYTVFHISKQASTGSTVEEAITNWGLSPVGLGSLAAVGYVLLTR